MPLCIQELITVPANPDLSAIPNDAEFHPFVQVASFADNHQVGQVNRGLLRQDSSLNILLRVGPCMLIDVMETLDNRTVFIRKNFEHFSGFAAVLPGQQVNQIIFLYRQSGHRILSLLVQRSEFSVQRFRLKAFNSEP
jgi:hypothetical protein